MPELTASKKNNKDSIFPTPKTLGVFMFVVAVMAIIAGTIRSEFSLILIGGIIFIILAYHFFAVLVLAIIHRKHFASLSVQIIPSKISAGQSVEMIFSGTSDLPKNGLMEFPGVLIRYEIDAETKDQRKLFVVVDFANRSQRSSMNVQCRGAYFGKKESVNIFDALGFFQFSQTVSQNDDIKLLVTPPIIDEIIPVPYRSGGSEHREDFRFIKTDDLIDQRQYVPGDDPRRINWKLYGHVRELFVREGESEPPPKSKLLILIDTSVDETLYTFDAGRSAIDALCSYALAVALESSRCGLEVSIGCNGSEIKSAKEQELASLLSFPYAAAFRESSPLAEPSDNCAIIILALPRESAEMGSLDSFLKKRKPHQPVDIWFVYKNEYESRAAELCARMYNQKGGVYAHCIHAV